MIDRERALNKAYSLCEALQSGETKDCLVYWSAIGIENGYKMAIEDMRKTVESIVENTTEMIHTLDPSKPLIGSNGADGIQILWATLAVCSDLLTTILKYEQH